MGLTPAFDASAFGAAARGASAREASAGSALAELAAFSEGYAREIARMSAAPQTPAPVDLFIAEFTDTVGRCLRAGAADACVRQAVAPLRAALAGSPLIRRGQERRRGHAGDFEMIEYLLSGRNDAEPGTLGWQIDAYVQDSAITGQHRNKITYQAGLIRRTLSAPGADPAGRRVLLIAAGAAADLRAVEPELFAPGDLVVLNDVDAAALAHAAARLAPETARHTVTEEGNAFQALPALERHGPYDLVLAGGLFDYLTDRYARLLVTAVMTRLCAPGGLFLFTNIATGNPFAHLMKYLADWPLIERAEDDVRALVQAAAPHRTESLRVESDTTGYTLLAHLTRVGPRPPG
ncbi:hypothetical protein C6N75_29440 [Streptomyces solincola]|uniref:Methyltransferase type 12 domain-containing protein n=1 Tax=Streptomyces solincola TaxID=2100817 RepID=A0A2S9PMU3_9ACTN|nr:methyltransferase [Streptomyces solincola]PRH75726.1 hypothetical protein C6N75_29440 [Streptomyces solincola]